MLNSALEVLSFFCPWEILQSHRILPEVMEHFDCFFKLCLVCLTFSVSLAQITSSVSVLESLLDILSLICFSSALMATISSDKAGAGLLLEGEFGVHRLFTGEDVKEEQSRLLLETANREGFIFNWKKLGVY